MLQLSTHLRTQHNISRVFCLGCHPACPLRVSLSPYAGVVVCRRKRAKAESWQTFRHAGCHWRKHPDVGDSIAHRQPEDPLSRCRIIRAHYGQTSLPPHSAQALEHYTSLSIIHLAASLDNRWPIQMLFSNGRHAMART